MFYLDCYMTSRNLMFYYGTGISFGLLASLLIVVFVLSRFMPQVCVNTARNPRPNHVMLILF